MTLLDLAHQLTDPLADRATPLVVEAALRAMAAALRLKPSLRGLLAGKHPDGTPQAFTATFLFTTFDAAVNVSARFAGGRMTVHRGPVDGPDVRVRFRHRSDLRAFFTANVDLFDLMLKSDLVLEGNLAYLSRFGHLAAALRLGGEPLPGRPRLPGPARWEDLPVPPAGEPCLEPPPGECTALPDPYLARYTLADFPRLRRLLWAHRTVPPAICTERPRLLTAWKLSAGPRPEGRGARARHQARALHHLLTHRRAIVHDDDVLLGTTTSQRIGVMIHPECGGTAIWPELLTMDARPLNPYRISREDIAILDREVFPFWMDDNVREWTRRTFHHPEALRLDERWVLYFQWKNHAVSHTIADLPAVLSRGLLAIADEAREHETAAADPDDRAFYEALRIAVDGVVSYGRRIAAAAREAAARLPGDAPRRAELEAMARAAEHAPAHPARTLHEAVQAIWTLFHCLHQENTNAGLSLGRLDVWLEPFLQRDLEAAGPAGREAVVERALELFGALMLKATDHLPLVPDIGNRLFGGSSSDQVITLGGVRADGTSAVGDMTWIALKCTEMLRLRDPNVNARYAPGVTSEAYLRRLCELNLLTRATPSIHNDRAVITALASVGFTTEHARDWSATGCVEPTSCGRHFGHTGCLMFNLVAALEMALHDGVHPLLGERIGPRTGDPRGFATFEAMQEAFIVQLRALLDRAVEGNDQLGRAHQVLRPTPLLSAVFSGPMEKGRDVIEGGAIYNSTGMANIGLSDVVDSLAAIQTLVYDERRFTMDALLAALADDFVGHGPLLATIRARVPRFGTDHPLPRRLANEVIEAIGRHLETQVSYRGGRYLPGYWSMSNHVAFGKLSGALPSGRRRGQPFTPGLTPSVLSGASLTEQLRAVAGLDPRRLPNNLAFNVKVVPGADEPHCVTVDRLAACAAAYADLGGMQLQFNVVSSETLRQARREPAAHADLLVRISGYNAYFVELNADLQEELIARLEHPL